MTSQSLRVGRRMKACVEAWPDCESGKYDPRCCRFPKSCSCTVDNPASVREDMLEQLECCCTTFSDLPAGTIIADLTCPIHGLNGTDPGDVLPETAA